MNAVAEVQGRIPLAGSYHLVVDTQRDEVNFRVFNGEEKQVMAIEVRPPLQRESWRPEWTAERDAVEYAKVVAGGINRYAGMTARTAEAVGEALRVAGEFARRLDDQHAEELAYQEGSKRDQEEERARERAQEQQQRVVLKEAVQWYIGQKFKLKREGYKATVFGVIDRISDTTIYTTSERGVRMETELLSLTELHIMYEGEKRYTRVFPN